MSMTDEVPVSVSLVYYDGKPRHQLTGISKCPLLSVSLFYQNLTSSSVQKLIYTVFQKKVHP